MRIPGPGQPDPQDQLAKAFAAFGLVPEGEIAVEEDYHLWPENVAVFNAWLAVQTQWHTDFGRRTGLNYPGVQICINNLAPRKERQWYFAAIQAMERAALDEWSQDR